MKIQYRSLFPEGTAPLAAGLLVNGITSYAFFIVSNRALGDAAYGHLAVLWVLVYILGPGLFQPLEQEIARATALRRSIGQGSAPILRQVLRIGVAQFLLVAAGLTLAWGFGLAELLGDNASLLLALGLALMMFMFAQCARGVLAGRHEFRIYRTYSAAEGTIRLAAAVGLATLGIATVGAYAFTLALAFAVATLVSVASLRPFVRPGPPASLAQVTPNFAWLLIASVSEAFLLNVGPLALGIVGRELGAELPGLLLNGLIVARVPLFFFQAVRASLLPNLSARVGARDFAGFRGLQLRLVGAVAVVAVVNVLVMVTLGPWLVSVLFGDVLRVVDMGLLAAGAGGFMILVSLSLGLVALGKMRMAALAFLVGVVAFPVAMSAEFEPLLRVEVALLAAIATAMVATAIMLRFQYAHNKRMGIRNN